VVRKLQHLTTRRQTLDHLADLLDHRGLHDVAIVVVEQYLDFARQIADQLVVMDRGEVVLAGGDE
jgi:ABC-type branched-subunit amino acid transport system ATPase component